MCRWIEKVKQLQADVSESPEDPRLLHSAEEAAQIQDVQI